MDYDELSVDRFKAASQIKGPDGTRQWFHNGLLHREDGPAIEYADGSKHWYRHGVAHRDEGPAVEKANGLRQWRHNGVLHRIDGPAVEKAGGFKSWYVDGKLHRENGPAVERPDGTCQWYFDGCEAEAESVRALVEERESLRQAKISQRTLETLKKSDSLPNFRLPSK